MSDSTFSQDAELHMIAASAAFALNDRPDVSISILEHLVHLLDKNEDNHKKKLEHIEQLLNNAKKMTKKLDEVVDKTQKTLGEAGVDIDLSKHKLGNK